MRHFQEGEPSWRGTQAPQARPLSAWQAAPRAREEPEPRHQKAHPTTSAKPWGASGAQGERQSH